jgi:hypothetical protein
MWRQTCCCWQRLLQRRLLLQPLLHLRRQLPLWMGRR